MDWAKATGTLAWGDDNGEIYLLDARSDKTQEGKTPIRGFRDSITCLKFSEDGKLLISAGGQFYKESNAIHVWSLATLQETKTFTGHHAPVFAVALFGNASAASADSTGHVCLWDPNTGASKMTYQGGGEASGKVYWDPTGHILAWGGLEENSALNYAFSLDKILPAPLPNGVLPLNNPAGWTTYLDKQGDKKLQANKRGGDTLQVWRKGNVASSIEMNGPIESYTFTRKGDIVVGAGGHLALYAGNVAGNNPQLLCTFLGHEGSVRSAAVSPANADYLATASTDRTVRLWSLNPKDWTQANGVTIAKPLLSLFMADNGRWIAWTEAGYYYASPDGEELIGWQENQGPDKPAIFHSTNDFRARYRNRSVIRLAFDKGDVGQAVAQLVQQGQKLDANATIQQEIQNAPRLALVSVEGAQRVGADDFTWTTNQPKATVQVKFANAADPAGIELKLSRPFGSLSPNATRHLVFKKPTQPADERALNVDLLPDDNEIHIQARQKGEDACYGEPLVLHIRYTPPPNEDTRPSFFAQTIGIQQFTDKQIMAEKVLYTVKDAKDISRICQDKTKGIFKSATVEPPILDKDATAENVKTAVRAIMQKANRGDVVLLYLASHAMPSPAAQVGSANLYFAMHNTVLDPNLFFDSSLACSDLLTVIKDNIKDAVKVLLVLDTCFSAKFADAVAYNDAVGAIARSHVRSDLL